MRRERLNPKIREILIKKSGLKIESIGPTLSRIRKNTRLLLMLQHRFSLRKKGLALLAI